MWKLRYSRTCIDFYLSNFSLTHTTWGLLPVDLAPFVHALVMVEWVEDDWGTAFHHGLSSSAPVLRLTLILRPKSEW